MGFEPIHTPVLLKETMEMLNIRENGTYVDATVGLGGHAAAMLSRLGPAGRLVGIDRDDDALRYAHERLGNKRITLKKGSFSGLKDMLLSMGINKIDGIVFDLGVSMFQLKEMGRGFSFMSDARLDMRMDTEQERTAWDIVNKYPEKEMERILREYGEEPYAKRIAKAVAFSRTKKKIDTCRELADIVSRACGRRGKTHPATRTFQALRIEVNKEMDELRKGLESAVNMLTSGGRLCVISYHSLEDRIVKNFIRDGAREGFLEILTKKPVSPVHEEIRRNPSSRSAKLRGAEKIGAMRVMA